jgi:hypothetical protein
MAKKQFTTEEKIEYFTRLQKEAEEALAEVLDYKTVLPTKHYLALKNYWRSQEERSEKRLSYLVK